jgi:hypothetical protein
MPTASRQPQQARSANYSHRDPSPSTPGQMSPSRSYRAVLKYTRTLSQIIGVITDPAVLADLERQSTPAGLGVAADAYLDAHGYDASVKLHIAHAYRSSNDVDRFLTYLCSRGMAHAEAQWLFNYISSDNLR